MYCMYVKTLLDATGIHLSRFIGATAIVIKKKSRLKSKFAKIFLREGDEVAKIFP
jgi:hypothetical protein